MLPTKRSKKISRYKAVSDTLKRLDPIVFIFFGLVLILYVLANTKEADQLAVKQRAMPADVVSVVMSISNISERWLGKSQVLAVNEGLGEVLVFDFDSYPIPFEEGDLIEGRCETNELSQDLYYEKSLLAKGVKYRAVCTEIKVLSNPMGASGAKWRLRASIRSLIQNHLKSPLSSLLLGMLSGDDSNMPRGFGNIMRDVGLTHIVVVSGYNVSVVYRVFATALKGIGRKASSVIGLLGLGVFTWIIGPEPPIIRAVAMAAIAAIATASGRKVTGLRALLLGSALMLIWKTEWVNSVSFHLSFLATLAILHTGVLTPLWVSKMGLLGSFLGEYLIQTLIVLAFTVPYTLAIFGKFSWIALVSNILVLPACKPIMAFGAIAILMGIMSRVLGKLFFSFVWIFLWYVLFVASRLSEMAEPIEGNISLPVMFLIYGILAVSIFVLNVVRNGQR